MAADPENRRISVIRHVREEFDLDSMELEELLRSLRMNVRELRDNLQRSVKREERQELAWIGYALQGLGTNLDQGELLELGEALETSAENGRPDELRRLASGIDKLLDDLNI